MKILKNWLRISFVFNILLIIRVRIEIGNEKWSINYRGNELYRDC